MRRAMIVMVVVSLMVALVAGTATAKGKGKGPKPDKTVTYVFEGTIDSVDEANGFVMVSVERANKAAGSFVGQQKAFAVTGTTKIRLDDARATIADLDARDLVVIQAKAPRGAISFAARMISAESPPAPYYLDADGDGIGAGEPGLYVPGSEPSGWVSQGGDNCPDVANPDQADTDGNGTGDACQPATTTGA